MRGLRFAVVLSLLVASPALAEEPTLTDYLKAALAHNPGARISQADLAASEAARLDALASLLPGITADGEYVYNQSAAIVPFEVAPGPPPVFQNIVITAQ